MLGCVYVSMSKLLTNLTQSPRSDIPQAEAPSIIAPSLILSILALRAVSPSKTTSAASKSPPRSKCNIHCVLHEVFVRAHVGKEAHHRKGVGEIDEVKFWCFGCVYVSIFFRRRTRLMRPELRNERLGPCPWLCMTEPLCPFFHRRLYELVRSPLILLCLLNPQPGMNQTRTRRFRKRECGRTQAPFSPKTEFRIV